MRTTVAKNRYWTILRNHWIFGCDNCLMMSAVFFILPNIKVLPGEIFDLGQKIVILEKFRQTRRHKKGIPRLSVSMFNVPGWKNPDSPYQGIVFSSIYNLLHSIGYDGYSRFWLLLWAVSMPEIMIALGVWAMGFWCGQLCFELRWRWRRKFAENKNKDRKMRYSRYAKWMWKKACSAKWPQVSNLLSWSLIVGFVCKSNRNFERWRLWMHSRYVHNPVKFRNHPPPDLLGQHAIARKYLLNYFLILFFRIDWIEFYDRYGPRHRSCERFNLKTGKEWPWPASVLLT